MGYTLVEMLSPSTWSRLRSASFVLVHSRTATTKTPIAKAAKATKKAIAPPIATTRDRRAAAIAATAAAAAAKANKRKVLPGTNSPNAHLFTPPVDAKLVALFRAHKEARCSQLWLHVTHDMTTKFPKLGLTLSMLKSRLEYLKAKSRAEDGRELVPNSKNLHWSPDMDAMLRRLMVKYPKFTKDRFGLVTTEMRKALPGLPFRPTSLSARAYFLEKKEPKKEVDEEEKEVALGWTKASLEQLKELVKLHGRDWIRIGKIMGKDRIMLRRIYTEHVAFIKEREWTPEDFRRRLQMVKLYGLDLKRILLEEAKLDGKQVPSEAASDPAQA